MQNEEFQIGFGFAMKFAHNCAVASLTPRMLQGYHAGMNELYSSLSPDIIMMLHMMLRPDSSEMQIAFLTPKLNSFARRSVYVIMQPRIKDGTVKISTHGAKTAATRSLRVFHVRAKECESTTDKNQHRASKSATPDALDS